MKEQQTENKQTTDVPVIKATNEDMRQATFVVLVPDEVDLHGDVYSESEVAKAAHSYNLTSMRTNLFHKSMTESWTVIESYILPTDIMLEDRFIKKGTWMIVAQINDAENLWPLIKSGKIKSVSIGAMAKTQKLE